MSETISESKKNVLEQKGYNYHGDRMLYYNRATKKVFSVEAIEDHNEAWLMRHISERSTENWQFYTNTILSDERKAEIEADLTL